jgi:ElaB/YqjD/DUF883 family membrane-anchored ribosome-binding protein
MAINNGVIDKTEETAAEFEGPGKSIGYRDVKKSIADTLHHVAQAVGEKATGQDGESGIFQCGKKASEWLDHSAEYVRQFDYKRVDAGVRQYVKQNPARSLLIAGAVGLMIGVILRRR